MLMRWSAWVALALAGAHLGAACGDDDGSAPPDASPPHDWQVVHQDLDGALLSVWGSSEDDVWTVGGDPDTGPMVLHWAGSAWETLDPESPGDLWWVFGFDGGPIFMGGAGGRILRRSGSSFEEMPTPMSTPVVFGIWGCSQDDIWAVGGNFGGGSGGFAWHLEGGEWIAHDLPDGEVRPVWKVVGRSCDDVRFVGEGGLSFSWDGAAFAPEATGIGESLFTDAVVDDCYLAVGGLAGIILEDCGSGWQDVSPDGALGLNGVCAAGGAAYATGQFGSLYRRSEDGSWIEDDGPPISETLHGCWVDPSDGVWAVGGQVLSPPLSNGVMVYQGGQEFAEAGS
jgi:hypothetical protein